MSVRFLRTNTAVIVTVGPFYDRTDGVTIETGLTITNERITLTADTDAGSAPTNILDNVTGATSGTDNDLNYITGNDAGMMQLELSAANTNRLGRMLLSITDAANHVPVFHEFMVLPAMIYDAFVLGTDVLDASVTQWLGTAAATPTVAGVPEVDLTHVAGATTNVAALATNVDAILADTAVIGSTGQGLTSLATQASVTTIDGIVDDILVDTAEIGTAGAGLTNINLPDQTMDIVGNITGNLSGSVGSVTGAVGSVTGAVGSVTGLTASDVGAIKAKTDNLPSDPADASVVAGLIAAAEAKIDIIDTNVDAILVDTGTTLDGRLPAALVSGRMASDAVAISGSTTAADNVEALIPNLDATISSVGGGAAPSASAIADEVETRTIAAVTSVVNPVTIVPPTNPAGIKRNTALSNFTFVMLNTAGAETTGLSVTATRKLDSGAFAACSNGVTEVGGGVYVINLSAADLNGDVVTLKFTAAGAKPRILTILTEP